MVLQLIPDAVVGLGVVVLVGVLRIAVQLLNDESLHVLGKACGPPTKASGDDAEQYGQYLEQQGDKIDLVFNPGHCVFSSTLLIHRRRFPASPAGKWTHSPDSVKRFPPY